MIIDKTMNVLIVDDYKTMLRIIRNLLKQIEFSNVEEASDGAEALVMLRAAIFGPGDQRLEHGADDRPATAAGGARRARLKNHAVHHDHRGKQGRERWWPRSRRACPTTSSSRSTRRRCATRLKKCLDMADQAPAARPPRGTAQPLPAARPELVAEVVQAVLETMQGDLSAQETSLLSKVEELGRTIASPRPKSRRCMSTTSMPSHIPSATDELDAIVAHTASATDIISKCAKRSTGSAANWQGKTGSPRAMEAASALQHATTRIYEACSFQDITGQRITKVVATLKTIEAKVASIVTAFGGRRVAAPVAADG